jgi:hypothetical protein
MGHIPAHNHGSLAGRGIGAAKRDTFHASTNLGDTFTRRVPGYSGHVPRFAATVDTDVTVGRGQFAATEAGRADHLITQHWAAVTGALAGTRGSSAGGGGR